MASNLRPLMVEVERVPESTAPPAPAASPEVLAEQQAAQIQAMSEGVKSGDTVEVLGDRYFIGSKVGLMPLMKFAHTAKRGVDADDMEGMAAMYELLQDCIATHDWDRFERDMTAKKADGQDLFSVIGEVIEILSARPTRRPSGSSSTSSTTTGSSTDSSSAVAGRRVPPGAEDLVPVDQLAASAG
jgi:hypothetical protein